MVTMNVEKPPLGSPRSISESDSAWRSSFGSRKSQRTSASDSPSGSASNAHGRSVLNRRLRSVLSHPLGLPLFYVLQYKNPSTLSFLGRNSKKGFTITDGAAAAAKNKKLDAILKSAVEEWVEEFPTKQKREEPQLTKLISAMIEKEYSNTGFHSDAEVVVKYENRPKPSRIGILFSPEEVDSKKSSTPFAIIEVGRHDLDWWKKLDQNFKYLVSLGAHQRDTRLRFEKPLLFAVLTIEGEAEAEAQQLRVKLGVFLCSPKDPKNPHYDFRMTLLSHLHTENLQEASKAFGQLLRATSVFSHWRESADETVESYRYFSSNCCRIGQYVLRSYDSRFRPTNRSPEIYLSPECRDIVGGEPTEVAKFPEDFDTAAFNHGDNGGSCDDSIWSNKSQGRGLLIIATPYRDGGHVAKSAKVFLPIIAELELLHKKGFVHGDIRAFNTVFGEQDNEGWLIDFDFGGQIGATCYPEGYRQSLADGERIGSEKEIIEKWHDWYALGKLIFTVHNIKLPIGYSQEHELKLGRMERFWEKGIEMEPSESKKEELKSFLREIDEQGWQVTPSTKFQAALKDTSTGPMRGTYEGATGSPPEKKN